MKKSIFIIILGILEITILAMSVLAATTLSLSPLSIGVKQGQSFKVVVKVDPQGIKNYTAKIQIQYPAELLEVRAFTLGDGWMILSQPGYDLVDNTKGILIKTAGYPGGVSELITFSTVLFSAKKTGEGIIKIGGDSVVLDGDNHNVLSVPLAQTLVTITAPVPLEEALPSKETLPVPKEEIIPLPRPLFDILIAPVAKELRKWSLISAFEAIGVLIIIIIVAYIIYRKRKRKIVQ